MLGIIRQDKGVFARSLQASLPLIGDECRVALPIVPHVTVTWAVG